MDMAQTMIEWDMTLMIVRAIVLDIIPIWELDQIVREEVCLYIEQCENTNNRVATDSLSKSVNPIPAGILYSNIFTFVLNKKF